MEERWIQTKSLFALLDWEPFILLTLLMTVTWSFYKLFLSGASHERHERIRKQYRNLSRHYLLLTFFFVVFHAIKYLFSADETLMHILPYIGVITFVWGGVVFVHICRLIILQYLFLGSMRAGVPILIVNIFTLAASALLIIWGAAQIFALQIGPLLATSAAFSIVLGLAMQDTLGNLFAGIALQLDKVFEIGDWLEVMVGSQKVTGQVKEMTWRATTLVGWSDEIIVIPNRTMASSQISNFQNGEVPVVRSQFFRLPYNADVNAVKKALIKSAMTVEEVRKYPEPNCFISESTEHWLTFKLIYFIDRYGRQFLVADQILLNGWKALGEMGYTQSAAPRLQVENLSS